MNEITNIHLGRQPFVIAVDARKLLQDYLHEVKRQVGSGGEGVLDEVEVRMAELLAERGVTGNNVILADDIAYLKEQLGSPSDFKDDEDTPAGEEKTAEEGAEPTKRLFRDTQHAMVAGVSSGLGAYFGIDPVFFRIFFAIATVAAGWGAIVYIILWIVMPEAKTASERLQMRGKAVTVDSLKEVVERADVSGAAHRASRSFVVIFEVAAKILLAMTGAFVAIFGALLLTAIGMLGFYALTHGGHLVHGAVQFPVGNTETLAAIGGIGVLTAIAVFVLATGIAMVRRKWPMPGWVAAALGVLLLISVAIGGATLPDTVQNMRERYRQNSHTTVRTLDPFSRVDIRQGSTPVTIERVYDGTHKVEVRYLGDMDINGIKTTVQDDTLLIDTHQFKPGDAWEWDCDGLCIGDRDYFRVIVHLPRKGQPVEPQAAQDLDHI